MSTDDSRPDPNDPDNPWYRLAQAAAEAEGGTVRVARPPKVRRYPGGLTVHDASLGRRRTWKAEFAWEGRRWLEALAGLDIPQPAPVRVLGYLSESPELRRMLALQAEAQLRGRGVRARATVRSSYKTGLFWATEEVLPRLRRDGADGLRLAYPVAAEPPSWRFLQETFPLAGLLEAEGITFASEPRADGVMGYRAVAFRGATVLWQLECPLPLYRRATVDGSGVWATTGLLRLEVGGRALEERIPTDGELFWDWFYAQVLPQVLELAAGKDHGSFFRNLTVAAELSEPEVRLGVGQECASMPEALAEEVYFTTLEAFKHAKGVPAQGRGLPVGRIVPVMQALPGVDGRARVVLIENGAEAPERLAVPSSGRGENLPTAFEADGWRPAWEGGLLEGEADSSPPPLPSRPLMPEEVWQAARHLARRLGLRLEVRAYSYDGRPVVALSKPFQPGRPGLLITAGQHANEPTGPKAALRLIERLAGEEGLNWAAFPLENPDGTRLHHALMQLAPHHMHHPARYTALGDDLQSRMDQPRPRWESAGRHWALGAMRPLVHLNLHGYPSHEWVRPFTGYSPRGFEGWALPMGVLMVLNFTPQRRGEALELGEAIAAAMNRREALRRLTDDALRWREAHALEHPYRLIGGFPFLIWEREGTAERPIEVITEMPDETVYGREFELLTEAQTLAGETVIDWLKAR